MITSPILMDLDVKKDSRGYFFEFFNVKNQNLFNGFEIKQVNVSMSDKGVIRGMHYQSKPSSQSKIITCLSGSIIDLCVEIKEGIPITSRIFEFTLNSQSNKAIYVPKNYAHGFQALEENTIVCYLVDVPYTSEAEKGFSPLSPFLRKFWPINKVHLSERDSLAPTF